MFELSNHREEGVVAVEAVVVVVVVVWAVEMN